LTFCGGNPQGTYDYTGGCVADPFASLRTQCPTLDTSGVTVTVTGTIYFVGSALHRNVKLAATGTVNVPASCAAGQCAAAQAGLQGAGITATCTGSSSCSCTISKTDTNTAATTFTISGNTLTTADGENYDICEKPGTGKLTYKGTSTKSESGSWELTKR
jgi:hypothetical protein